MRPIDFIILIVSILLVLIVLMQQSKDDINDAFSGSKSELFKNQKSRGIELFLKVGTAVLAVLFVILVLAAAAMQING
jgi:preprotein translocase subunit SecG